eukprot:CAMPEP_0202784514 /NCGR_PEP_ID=MMETSP1388-20130828/66508_1 /ASSEMBLY_ACC=CAM_ASM_000864 /TAXON_ID=37098 /ORGANISM="Isochrysis sp, Strain CCMP1244" /LENGTH=114 /DNA_ID=CAMNT_0049454011 /DNA_START=304 /DNA_END=645 /DNA_ORIENTATION=+
MPQSANTLPYHARTAVQPPASDLGGGLQGWLLCDDPPGLRALLRVLLGESEQGGFVLEARGQHERSITRRCPLREVSTTPQELRDELRVASLRSNVQRRMASPRRDVNIRAVLD